MPFKSGRAIYGYPREGAGTFPSLASEFYAVKPGDNTFSPVTEIYLWCESSPGVGSWVPMWVSSASAPASASASYGGLLGNPVVVTWTLPAGPEWADSYTVRRADGSLVGSTPTGVLTLNDTSPRALNGAYTVTANLGSTASTTPTNSLSLAAPPTSLSVTWNFVYGPGAAVSLTWNHPSYGLPHQYRIYRNGVLMATISGTTNSWADLVPLRGQVSTYEVRPFFATEGAGVSGAIAIPAANPVPSLGVVPSFGYGLRLSWPALTGTVTGFEVELYGPWTSNIWEPVGTDGTSNPMAGGPAVFPVFTTVWHWDWLPGGFYPGLTDLPHYMRVRALSPGGASQWVTLGGWAG